MSAAPGLALTARQLVATGKGLLAIDESITTCNARLVAAGIAPGVAARLAWRDLLITGPGLAGSISGVILNDETVHQSRQDGTPLVRFLIEAGMVPGVKVDAGAKALAGHPGETVTEGLDGLRARLLAYRDLGVRFAKWRAVISPSPPLPSLAGLATNAHALARYAALCQETGLVPIVEPEVLMDGDHDLARSREVTGELLHQLFHQLYLQGVVLDSVILKVNMVLPGLGCALQPSLEEVADCTLACLRDVVPAAVAGIALLSGGQASTLATARLNALHMHLSQRPEPWPLTFSFARALQQPALALWGGEERHRASAQSALLQRARCNAAALRGAYRGEPELV